MGFYWLEFCYQTARVCEKDLRKARDFYLIAGQLGLVVSMSTLGGLLDESGPQRWIWWGRAAVRGFWSCFLNYFSKPVQKFNSGSENGAVVFQIGRVLNTAVDAHQTAIFFYKLQLSACRLAVDTWSHVGIQCGVVKDIRVLIGKLVWESRDLALYKFD